MHGLGTSSTLTYRVGHLFCGVGAGAKGFSAARPTVRGVTARFVCAGGIDIDAGAIRNFGLLTGTPGTVMDLFDREQYIAWHSKEPPADWREATPADIRRAHGDLPLDVMFLSAPCKGFSGLLSSTQSETDKYQALNRLTLRGIWLTMEAYKDDPIRILLFENVPRIATRGRPLLDKIKAILRHYGYVVTESEHDCGELGGLGQSRKRFLLVARKIESVPNFIYEPEKKRLRGVGEIIGRLPLPGDPVAGIMHRVPLLQWKTWVRLAFVPAGKDWRALNSLEVVDGHLRDYGIMPDHALRDNALGVNSWDDTAPVITAARAPGQGRFSVADPRPQENWNADVLGVRKWEQHTGTVPGRSGATNGAHSVADPRTNGMRSGGLGVLPYDENSGVVAGESLPTNGAFSVADPRASGYPHHGTMGVTPWEEPAGVVAAASRPANGPHSVADPRPAQSNQTYGQYGVKPWADTAATVTSQSLPGGGPNSVADPRLLGKPRFNNTFRIVPFDQAAPAVAGPGGPAGGHAVADPRAPNRESYSSRKYRVTPYDESSRTVIGASTTGDGAFAVADPRGGPDPKHLHGKHRIEEWDGAPSRAVIAGRENGASAVADPRPGYGPNTHQNILAVTDFDEHAKSVTSASHVAGGALSVADPRTGYGDSTHKNVLRVVGTDEPSPTVTAAERPSGGAMSVADPRPVCLNAADRDGYATQGHYGVQEWEAPTGAIPAHPKNNNGKWSVADPRDIPAEQIEALPAPKDRLVARIISLDETWHRPFTTLELAALQSLFDPDEIFAIDPELQRWTRRADFDLVGASDAGRREWIGNAVPSEAARAMAEEVGESLILADLGETFTLSAKSIWCRPISFALAVDPRQSVCGEAI